MIATQRCRPCLQQMGPWADGRICSVEGGKEAILEMAFWGFIFCLYYNIFCCVTHNTE